MTRPPKEHVKLARKIVGCITDMANTPQIEVRRFLVLRRRLARLTSEWQELTGTDRLSEEVLKFVAYGNRTN